ncbi:hypothetical protein [Streptomyces sp. NPDC001070]
MFATIPVRPRVLTAAGTAAALALALAACGSGDSSMPGMHHDPKPSSSASAGVSGTGHDSMPDMDHGSMGDGLTDAKDGYAMTSAVTELPAGRQTDYTFRITGPDGKPVTGFALDQTKRMHFYAIRSDLTGFQHLHPAMAANGTWTAGLAGMKPGAWRLYASFTPDSGPGRGEDFVLSRTATIPGTADETSLPEAATGTETDGYTVSVKGEPMAGMAHPLTVGISKDGKPVTDLQPYLDTYAHLTAFHEGDRAFAHLHPETRANGGKGGPDLAFQAMLPKSGNWRLFLQFQTGGTLHTAELTLNVD